MGVRFTEKGLMYLLTFVMTASMAAGMFLIPNRYFAGMACLLVACIALVLMARIFRGGGKR